ncbi:MAG TPA: nucleotidyltransferase [Verrucomicrobiae bacterium]
MARQVQEFLDSRGWSSCVIGGIAVQRWGEPRLTRDVDVTLLTGFGDEERFVDEILRRFDSRIPEGRVFGLEHRVLLLATQDGTEIDLALGGLPFEVNVIDRASAFEFYPGMVLRTCSAEDLVVMKAFASRDLDWSDVKGIMVRQGAALNWETILSELRPLCQLKDAPEIVDRLEKLRAGELN